MAAAFARARAIAKPDASFLARIASDEISFRLSATKRVFSSALDLVSTGPELAVVLRAGLPALAIDRHDFSDWIAGAEIADRFADNSRDLVVSMFGLHRMEEPAAVLGIARRVLRPDGLFVGVLPGEGTLAELGEALLASELAEGGGAGLRIEPFVSLNQAGGWLQQAGFALPVADVERLTLRYSDLAGLVADLRAMAAGNCLAGGRPPLRKAAFGRIETEYRRRFADADGRLRVSVNLIFLSGWAPDESQQRPLRPGSARQRLSDALGVAGKSLQPGRKR